jgi:three-Cys-motif partner protein
MNADDSVIGDDGLPLTEVGAWTLEKHERLIAYVNIARAVRQKFAITETTYIELFSGPGRSIIKQDGRIIEGSPILAARTAKDQRVPFRDIHLADFEPSYVDAVRKRLPPNVGNIHSYVGAAETTVNRIASSLNPDGLHFAFLDPFKLDPLPFSIIATLANFKRMDMLIHVSIHDLQRNLRTYMEDGTLDRFAPGWRDIVNPQSPGKNVRIGIFQHWLGLIRNLDMAPSEGIEMVTGTNRQPLYWLVLVARHQLAHKFWDAIRNVSPQGRLGL